VRSPSGLEEDTPALCAVCAPGCHRGLASTVYSVPLSATVSTRITPIQSGYSFPAPGPAALSSVEIAVPTALASAIAGVPCIHPVVHRQRPAKWSAVGRSVKETAAQFTVPTALARPQPKEMASGNIAVAPPPPIAPL